MALDFVSYRSVSTDEMAALDRVVDAARGAARSSVELADALSQLDAIRRRGERWATGEAGTLVPWLHRHFRRAEGRDAAWRPEPLGARRRGVSREGREPFVRSTRPVVRSGP